MTERDAATTIRAEHDRTEHVEEYTDAERDEIKLTMAAHRRRIGERSGSTYSVRTHGLDDWNDDCGD